MNRKQKKKILLPFRNDEIFLDIPDKIDEIENEEIEQRKNKPISIFKLNEILNSFQKKVNELNDLIMSEKNMKQKFLKIGKKYAFNECIQELSDLIY